LRSFWIRIRFPTPAPEIALSQARNNERVLVGNWHRKDERISSAFVKGGLSYDHSRYLALGGNALTYILTLKTRRGSERAELEIPVRVASSLQEANLRLSRTEDLNRIMGQMPRGAVVTRC
jgi:hypothetical protein